MISSYLNMEGGGQENQVLLWSSVIRMSLTSETTLTLFQAAADIL